MLDRASPAHGYEIAIDQRKFHEYGIVVACTHALAGALMSLFGRLANSIGGLTGPGI
jgi:hypothetical protein